MTGQVSLSSSRVGGWVLGGGVDLCVEEGCVGDDEVFVGVWLEGDGGRSEFDDGICVGFYSYLLAFLEVGS